MKPTPKSLRSAAKSPRSLFFSLFFALKPRVELYTKSMRLRYEPASETLHIYVTPVKRATSSPMHEADAEIASLRRQVASVRPPFGWLAFVIQRNFSLRFVSRTLSLPSLASALS